MLSPKRHGNSCRHALTMLSYPGTGSNMPFASRGVRIGSNHLSDRCARPTYSIRIQQEEETGTMHGTTNIYISVTVCQNRSKGSSRHSFSQQRFQSIILRATYFRHHCRVRGTWPARRRRGRRARRRARRCGRGAACPRWAPAAPAAPPKTSSFRPGQTKKSFDHDSRVS